MQTSAYIGHFALSHMVWYEAFHVHTALLHVIFQSGSHTLVVPGENLPRQLITPRKFGTLLCY